MGGEAGSRGGSTDGNRGGGVIVVRSSVLCTKHTSEVVLEDPTRQIRTLQQFSEPRWYKSARCNSFCSDWSASKCSNRMFCKNETPKPVQTTGLLRRHHRNAAIVCSARMQAEKTGARCNRMFCRGWECHRDRLWGRGLGATCAVRLGVRTYVARLSREWRLSGGAPRIQAERI